MIINRFKRLLKDEKKLEVEKNNLLNCAINYYNNEITKVK